MVYIDNQAISTKDATITKSISGDFILTFTTYDLPDNVAFHNIVEDSVIFANGYEFIVKQLQATKNKKTVVAPSIFYANADIFIEGIYSSTRTFNEFATHALKGTGWAFTTDFGTEKRIIPNFGEENTVKLVEQLCAAYECEYEILHDKQIKFAKKLSADKGHIYRYGVNVKHLSSNVDSSNIKTRIKGFGANGLAVEYISPQEDKLGKRVAEPIRDDRYLHADSLRERLRMELQDYPLINFETDVIDLTSRELGETVTLVYEPMHLLVKVRVLEQTFIAQRGKWRALSVALGNRKIKSNVDALIDAQKTIADNKDQSDERFDDTDEKIEEVVKDTEENFAQINVRADAIEMSVKDTNGNLAMLEIRADKIESRVTDEVNGLSSKITQTAASIRSEVTDKVNGLSSTIEQTASSIRSEVKREYEIVQGGVERLDRELITAKSEFEQTADRIKSTVEKQFLEVNDEISTYKTTIEQLSDEINLKVDAKGVISAINLLDGEAKISASKITLEGAVTVLSEISGKLGDIYSGNIDISEDVTIGKNLTFKVGGRNFITFADQTYIGSDGSGGLLLTALNDLDIAVHSINFNNARVRNLNISGYAKGHTDGIGIAYSEGSNRLYVRIDGSNVGYIDLT